MTNKPGEFEGRLKEELEKALHEELGGDPYRRSNQLQIHECENIALWAAKWMAEYLIAHGEDATGVIRQLIQELE